MAAIGDRRLIWLGIRGQDGEPMCSFPQLTSCHGVTAAARVEGIESVTLEQLSGRRVDLDRYDIDEDESTAIGDLRQVLLLEMSDPSVVVPYRPSRFLSALHFANLETATIAGMFKEQHLPFEHKPWVETNLGRLGVPIVPWRYVADERHADLLRHLHEGPMMVRPNRGSGGVGLARVDDADELRARWPRQRESFASVAPFLENVVPVNVSGCVFADGTVTRQPGSVQLIGLRECIDRPFGYCGNDFGAFKALDQRIIEQIDELVELIGGWLSSAAYLGTFGVDFLVDGGQVLFSEINPRFQGSSHLQSEVCRWLGVPSSYVDHLAAFLGVEPDPRPDLRSMAAAQPDWAQLVVHTSGVSNAVPETGTLEDAPMPAVLDRSLVPDSRVALEDGAVVMRLTVSGCVTSTGFDLSLLARSLIDEHRSLLEGAEVA